MLKTEEDDFHWVDVGSHTDYILWEGAVLMELFLKITE